MDDDILSVPPISFPHLDGADAAFVYRASRSWASRLQSAAHASLRTTPWYFIEVEFFPFRPVIGDVG